MMVVNSEAKKIKIHPNPPFIKEGEKTVKNTRAGLGVGKNHNPTQPPLKLRGGEAPQKRAGQGGVIKKGKGKIHPTLPLQRKETNLSVAVYGQDGSEKGNMSLPADIFGLKVNSDLMAQAVRAQLANSRENIAHAKDRSEVRGGGKKPWKQKGTGRARHASIRSPLWAGGGVTFGPRKEKNFSVKINKKMKRLALLMALSGKVKDGELIVLDDLKLKEAKTKEMAEVVKNVFGVLASVRDKMSPTKVGTPAGTPVGNPKAMIVLGKNDEAVVRAARNLPRISTIGVGSLNIMDLLSVKYLVMMREGIERIKEIFGK